MAISNDKRRITISIDKDIVEKLEKMAKFDRRTLSNEIAFVLSDYIDKDEYYDRMLFDDK